MTGLTDQHFIVGDWGTTCLRLFLCENRGGRNILLASALGPGVKETTDFETTFTRTLADLPEKPRHLPIYLAGTIGSSLGWNETPYAPCPIAWHALSATGEFFHAAGFRVCIVPGVSCTNRFGIADFMRGEESQLLGWRQQQPASFKGRRLVCLPGTHVKWVIVDEARILGFDSTLQGEQFDILRRHSIMTRNSGIDVEVADRPEAFLRGVRMMKENPSMVVSTALFVIRSLQVTGDLAPDDLPSFLSGILIGADVRDIPADIMKTQPVSGPVHVIGEEVLARLYGVAFKEFDFDCQTHCGRATVIDGLATLHADFTQEDAAQ